MPFHWSWNVVLLLPLSTKVWSSLPTPLKIVEGVTATLPPPAFETATVTCGQFTLPMLLWNESENSVAESGVTITLPMPPTDELGVVVLVLFGMNGEPPKSRFNAVWMFVASWYGSLVYGIASVVRLEPVAPIGSETVNVVVPAVMTVPPA